MSKINKQLTEDFFSNLKTVDKLLNESAGVKDDTQLSILESKLKKRLLENEMELEEMTSMESSMSEDNNTALEEDNAFEVNFNLDDDANEEKQEQELSNEELMEMANCYMTEEENEEVAAPVDGLPEEGTTETEETTEETPEGEQTEEENEETTEVESPEGTQEVATEVNATPIATPEDIDQLIISIGLDSDETLEESIEVDKVLAELGYDEAQTEDLTDKVKLIESKLEKLTGKKVTYLREGIVDEWEVIKTQDLKDTVKGTKTSKAVIQNGKTNENGQTEGTEELDEKEGTENDFDEVKDTKTPSINHPKFSSLKEEVKRKNKALEQLAGKVIDLEDEVSKLKLENFKVKKTNTVLGNVNDLKEETKLSIIKKFDSCKSEKEVETLYEEVSVIVKQLKKGTLNEAVTKRSSKISTVIPESKENNEYASSNHQDRLNYLMGVGDKDKYFEFD